MQTSLRSNYQYYDYGGTLDCATGHIGHELLQHHHQHQQQQLPPPEESVNTPNQHHHNQPSSSATNQHHHQVSQINSQGTVAFDLQLASEVASVEDSCYQSHQDVSVQDASVVAPGDQQLATFDQQSHQHQSYQLLAANNNPQLNSSIQSDISSGLLDAGNIYHSQQQQHHVQTTSYQTIYYESINFTDNCHLEQGTLHPATSCEPREQQDFVNSQLVNLNQCSQQHQQSELQQQLPVSSENGCTYFQYAHQHSGQKELTSVLTNPHSESPLPPTIDNGHQSQATYTESQLTTTDDTQNQQVYHTLGTTNHHPFEIDHQVNQGDQFRSTAASQHEQQFDVNHLQHQQQSGEVEYRFKQSDQCFSHERNNNHEHHGHHHLNHHNFYLESESTGVSIAYSQESRSSTASTSPSEESSASTTLTRDERRAREANIPMTYYEIVNLSIEQFNERLTRHNLSESQLTLIKDIRRRGKNKVAAQSCRKRKMEQIYELQHEVNHLAYKRRALSVECSQLIKEHGNLVQEYDKIYATIQERMQ